MPKVLHLVSSNHFAGSERLALTLGKSLADSGECEIVFGVKSGGILKNAYQAAAVATAPVHLNSLFAKWRLAAWARRNRVDILHCHMSGAARIGASIARRLQIPVVTHLHFLKDSPIYRDPRSGILISISEHVTRFYIEQCRVPESRIRTIPNATHALEDFWATQTKEDAARSIREEFQLPASAKILSFAGRVSPEKGHEFFLYALPAVLERHPEVHAFIIGNLEQKSGYANFLKTICKKLHLEENVHFTGFRDDALRFTRAAHAQFVLSRDEPFGLVVPEAMALETPVIGADTGNIPNLLHGGELGEIVPYSNSKILSRTINEILESPQNTAQKTRRAAEIARQLYHPKTMSAAILNVYREALDKTKEHKNDRIPTR